MSNQRQMLANALALASRGWKVCPLTPNRKKPPLTPHGFMDASSDPAQIEAWWTASPLANIGIATGKASGIVVLDVDAPNGGHKHDGATSLAEAGVTLPETAVAETPSGGRHYFFRYYPGAKSATNLAVGGKKLMGVDVKGDGGYVVGVGSVIDGRPYRWISDTANLADFPEELKVTEREARPKQEPPRRLPASNEIHSNEIYIRAVKYLAKMPEAISGEEGHKALLKAASHLVVGFNLDDETAFFILKNEYNPRCQPPWSDKELRHKIQDAHKNPPFEYGCLLGAEREERPDVPLDWDDPLGGGKSSEDKLRRKAERPEDKWRPGDIANTDLLHEVLGDDYKYDVARGVFRHFDGVYWRPVENDESEIYDAIRRVHKLRLAEASRRLAAAAKCDSGEDEKATALRDSAKEQQKLASKAETILAVNAMRKLITKCRGVTPAASDWDTDIDDVLPVANGLVDLKTGELLPPDRKRMVTAASPLRYDPGATSERWGTFLDEATGGDRDLLDYLQLAAGYSVTGRTDEQAMFIIQGPGETGKSVFLSSISSAVGNVGGWGRSIDPALFCIRRTGDKKPVNSVADLAGVRLAIGEETSASDELDDGLVKQITGGQWINGRFLYRDAFRFRPVCKIWIATNHPIGWNANDSAMARRIVEIPFNHRPAVRDTSLPRSFTTSRENGGDAEAVLAWLVEGARKWYAKGCDCLKGKPAACFDLGMQNRAEKDVVGDFIKTSLVIDFASSLLRSEVFRRFEQFCRDNNRICNASARQELIKRLEKNNVVAGAAKGQVLLRGLQFSA